MAIFKPGDKVKFVAPWIDKNAVYVVDEVGTEFLIVHDKEGKSMIERKYRAVAANANFKVGDRVEFHDPFHGWVKAVVKKLDYGGHPGNIYVEYAGGSGSMPESNLRLANSRNAVVQNALNAARAGNFKPTANAKWVVSFYDGNPDVTVDAPDKSAAMHKAAKLRDSRNRAVFGESLGYPQVKSVRALNAAGVRSGNYEVTLETVDFSGNRTQTKNMTDAQLKSWLGLIHCGGIYAEAVERFGRGEKYYDANIDMHPTVHIKPIL